MPQFIPSVAVFTQRPPHALWPVGQAHTPAAQARPVGHARPQPPQFAPSVMGFTHAAPQASCPAGQLVPASIEASAVVASIEASDIGRTAASIAPASVPASEVIHSRTHATSVVERGSPPSGIREPQTGDAPVSFWKRYEASGSPGTSSRRPLQSSEVARRSLATTSGATRSRPTEARWPS